MPVDGEVREAVTDAALLCERLGHDVEVIDNPFPDQIAQDFLRYWGMLAFSLHRLGWPGVRQGLRPRPPRTLHPASVEVLLVGGRRAARLAAAAAPVRGGVRLGLLGDFDVHLSPVLGSPPVRIGHLGTGRGSARAPGPATPVRLLHRAAERVRRAGDLLADGHVVARPADRHALRRPGGPGADAARSRGIAGSRSTLGAHRQHFGFPGREGRAVGTRRSSDHSACWLGDRRRSLREGSHHVQPEGEPATASSDSALRSEAPH